MLAHSVVQEYRVACKPPFTHVCHIDLPSSTDTLPGYIRHGAISFNDTIGVFASGRNGLFAISLKDGEVLWKKTKAIHMGKKDNPEKGKSRTYIIGDKLWVLTMYNFMQVYDLLTGEQLGEFPTDSYAICGVVGNLIYTSFDIIDGDKIEIIGKTQETFALDTKDMLNAELSGASDSFVWTYHKVYDRKTGDLFQDFVGREVSGFRFEFYGRETAEHFLVGDQTHVKCYDKKSREFLWDYTSKGGLLLATDDCLFGYDKDENDKNFYLAINNCDGKASELDIPYCAPSYYADSWVDGDGSKLYNWRTGDVYDTADDLQLRTRRSIRAITGEFVIVENSYLREISNYDIFRGTKL